MSGEDNGKNGSRTIGYGVKLDVSGLSFINYGNISGSSSNSSYGYGIYDSSGEITNYGNISGSSSGYGYGSGIYNSSEGITNYGNISGSSSNSSSGYGIYDSSGEITNYGNISGSSSGYGYGYGIYDSSGEITNYGNISGSSSGSGSGIYNSSEGITNYGNISGSGSFSGSGYGVYNYKTTPALLNTGVIYGIANAIRNGGSGIISKAFNYGILANGNSSASDKVVEGLKAIDIDSTVINPNDLLNYGLIFNADGGKYISDDAYLNKFGTSDEIDVIVGYALDSGGNLDLDEPITEKYTIINAKAEGTDKNNLTGTESIELSGLDKTKKYILNGITDTLLVKGEEREPYELNNSIVNAYKTAIKIDGNSTYFQLNDAVVNGGLDGTLNSTTLENENYSPAILVTGNESFLTIKGDTVVNGEMKSTGTLNTLNLYGKNTKTRSSSNDSMNILNNITGFERIQIENDVTFFESAKVTGVDRININNGGTLNLRLQAGASPTDKATHALSGNAVTLPSGEKLLIAGKEEGGSVEEGTLNFITNGMGTGTVIDMAGITMENVKLRTSSILYKADVDPIDETIKLGIKIDLSEIYNSKDIEPDKYPKYNPKGALPDDIDYDSLDKIFKSSVAIDDNVNALTDMIDSSSDEEEWIKLLSFLGNIYTQTPYSYSAELSRRSMGMFRDIVTENNFRPDVDKWLIMGGLTHADGGTRDTYYGKNYYNIDSGSSSTKADMKLTGAYALGKYGYSENLSLGVTVGGNKSEAEMSMSKVKGNSGYVGAFAENYRGNLTLKAGTGIQYSEYDADRRTIGGHSYDKKYSDMAYDIYLNGRYSNSMGNNIFLEPYGTLSYTYVDQDGADEGSKDLAIETDSKSFDYTTAKVGVDLKKVIPHEKGKSTLSAGVSYTRILDGADEEFITGRFKGGTDFDILVAHKNEHSIGLNAKYSLELENGILFDVKGTYAVERDSHNQSGKNKAKGEWIVGAGVGYKF